MIRLKTGLMMWVIIFVSGLLLAVVPQEVLAENAKTGLTPAGKIMEDGIAVENYRSAAPIQVDEADAAGPVYYKTYTAFEFQPSISTLTFAPAAAALYVVDLPAGGPSFKKALDLSNGAQITRIDVYVVDNSASYDMSVGLFYCEPSSEAGQYSVIELTSSGFPTSLLVQTISATGNPIITVDNTTRQYYLRYGPVITGSDHMLVGARVQYTLPVIYLPKAVIQ
jgi:hypothetical protein